MTLGSEGKGPLADAGYSVIQLAHADSDEHGDEDRPHSPAGGIWKEIHEGMTGFIIFLVAVHVVGVDRFELDSQRKSCIMHDNRQKKHIFLDPQGHNALGLDRAVSFRNGLNGLSFARLIADYSIGLDLHQPLRFDETRHLHDGAGGPYILEEPSVHACRRLPVLNALEHDPGAHDVF